jgi:hypothetical protein
MKNAIDIYSRIGNNCPGFYPDFSSKKSCPEISRADCRNCRNFSRNQNRCVIDMFDKVLDNVLDPGSGF